MSWSELPTELLMRVLKHLYQRERLCNYATVSRSWHYAAAAATTVIEHVLRTDEQCSQLLNWFGQHGHHVRGLELGGETDGTSDGYESDDSFKGQPVVHLTALPCCRLQWLDLWSLKLQLAPAVGGSQGILQHCTGLQELSLTYCYMLEGPDSLTALTTLTQLVSLELGKLTAASDVDVEMPAKVHMPGTILQHLVHLTNLEIRKVHALDASFQHLSCLTALKDLSLKGLSGTITPGAFAGLECLQQLTMLHIARTQGVAFCVHSTPRLCQLTALQQLHLIHCQGLDPAVLANLKQLQELELSGTPLGNASSIAALLAVLPNLEQLTSLNLRACLQDCAPTAAAYSALTAASQLRELDLSDCLLPANAWQHMFSASRPCPSIHCLHLEQVRVLQQQQQQQQLSARHVQQLVEGCPSLKDLITSGFLQDSEQLAPLLQLSGLACLHLQGATNETVQAIAQLTSLRELNVTNSDTLSGAGVLHLTALRRLARLRLQCQQLQEVLSCDYCWNGVPYIVNRAPYGSPPDVWQRLLKACSQISECQPIIIMQQSQQLEEARRREEKLQSQMCEVQGSLDQLKQDMAMVLAQLRGS